MTNNNRVNDAIIASHIMGWSDASIKASDAVAELEFLYSRTKKDSFSGWDVASKLDRATENPHFDGHYPRYTTDVDADYEVLEKVRDSWCGESLNKFHKRLFETCIVNFTWRYKIGDYSRSALAALKIE